MINPGAGQSGKVYLVGAGPGDPGLLTLKAQRILAQAEVIIYDHLVDSRLERYWAQDAKLVYVGKVKDRHTLPQDEINRLLLASAKKYQVVVRLKGGDPFLFGRGAEEALFLAENGLAFEIVPGVSSALAVPAYAGIPPTYRQAASQVTILTGHEDPLKPEAAVDWVALGRSGGTLVILMGMERLASIALLLQQGGKAPDTPVAVIERGTLPEQITLLSDLEHVAEAVTRQGLSAPAVIVVGETAALRPALSWLEAKPLWGKKILVTRPLSQAGTMLEYLEDQGAAAYHFPLLRTEKIESAELDAKFEQLASYRWIIFNSVNGVHYFMEALKSRRKDIRWLTGVKLAAIGEKTGQALESYGLLTDYIPPVFVAESLAQGLKERIQPGEKVLTVRSDLGRPVLLEALAGQAEVEDLTIYRTLPPKPDSVKPLTQRRYDVITFSSASAVRNFFALLEPTQSKPDEKTVFACIGPVTAAALAAFGHEARIIARTYTARGLLEAIVDYYKQPEDDKTLDQT